jgi:hypothetical protein
MTDDNDRIKRLLEQRAQAVIDLDERRVASIDRELAKLGAQAQTPRTRATRRTASGAAR